MRNISLHGSSDAALVEEPVLVLPSGEGDPFEMP